MVRRNTNGTAGFAKTRIWPAAKILEKPHENEKNAIGGCVENNTAMRKSRSDSKFNGLPMEQRDQLVTWLFDEGMGYDPAAKKVQEQFGVTVSKAAVGRFYRRMADERHAAELAMAGGSVKDFRRAVRKLVGAATLNACINNSVADPREDNTKPIVRLARLMLDAEKRELKEQWLAFELQRLASKT